MGYNSLVDFVAGVWEASFMKMNPHDVLAMLWTGQHADISSDPTYNGDFDQALQGIKAHAYIMPGSTDLFCTVEDNRYEAERMPHASLRPIQSVWGHFAGRGINQSDNRFIDDSLRHLLALDVER